MFVCVVSLSQFSSRDLLYVKCLCVLSRYPSPVVEISYMLNVEIWIILSGMHLEIKQQKTTTEDNKRREQQRRTTEDNNRREQQRRTTEENKGIEQRKRTMLNSNDT